MNKRIQWRGTSSPVPDAVLIIVFIVLIASALIVPALWLFHGCGAGDDGVRALEESGFTDVELGDSAVMSCGKGDTYGSEFSATNPLGRRVNGVVCCGLIKGCTVRF